MIMKDDGFYSVWVRGGNAKKNVHCAVYMEDATEVPQRQVAFCGKENIMFCPG